MKPLPLLILFAGSFAHGAAAPDFLRAAIGRLNPEVPPGWTCTVTTTRGDESSVERLVHPPGGSAHWTLLQRNGRPATAGEAQRHSRQRAGMAVSSGRALFRRGDLDPDSAQLLREDEAGAEFRLRFRADVGDPILSRAVLEVRVVKSAAWIESCALHLIEPFSPALGVRMNELKVSLRFSPPEGARPPLPREAVSHFRGRMFLLVPLSEDVRVAYADFAPLTAGHRLP